MTTLIATGRRPDVTDPAAGTAAGPAGYRRPTFELPEPLEAGTPPEARGLTRDAVRMMVAHRHDGSLVHATFSELPAYLDDGDLVVVNTSGTLAASVPATDAAGRSFSVHLSTTLPAGLWTVELRAGDGPWFGASAGESFSLPGGGQVVLLTPYASHADGVRLWVATVDVPEPLHRYLAVHGRPIRYGYVQGEWPISMYQNVYATEPGSAEMPSAGRPFTPEVITRLVARGIGVAPIVLHTGVASPEASEPPYPEHFRVSAVDRAPGQRDAPGRRTGRSPSGRRSSGRSRRSSTATGWSVRASGWTETVVTPDRVVRSVDGLLTGWHEPEASHLAMLEAIAGRELLERSYAAALDEGYLWHEFGDVHLVLP